MEALKLKFAIQSPEDTLSGATDTAVEEITARSVRFVAKREVLEAYGMDKGGTLPDENRIVMFIYLEADQPPIRAIGQIARCEKAAFGPEETYFVEAEFKEIAPEDERRIERHLRKQRVQLGPAEDKRSGEPRRQSDRFLAELAQMLEILSRMSEGKKEDFGEHFADLVGVKDALGRRLEDRKLGELVCYNVERLASNIVRLVGKGAGLRRVQIRKVTGREEAAVAKDRVLVGWEESPPQVGKSYTLYLEGGGIFRSATVVNVLKDHFRTRNSLYSIQELRA
jgi:hypothetical protein